MELKHVEIQLLLEVGVYEHACSTHEAVIKHWVQQNLGSVGELLTLDVKSPPRLG